MAYTNPICYPKA